MSARGAVWTNLSPVENSSCELVARPQTARKRDRRVFEHFSPATKYWDEGLNFYKVADIDGLFRMSVCVCERAQHVVSQIPRELLQVFDNMYEIIKLSIRNGIYKHMNDFNFFLNEIIRKVFCINETMFQISFLLKKNLGSYFNG